MRSALLLAAIFVLFLSCSLIAQPPGAAPAGAGDKNITNDNTKMRSIELERVKRDAEKPDRTKQDSPPPPTVNFQQVKEDFEAIQKLQDDIINAYSKGSVIDFARISIDAAQLNQSAARLESNLFPLPPPPEKKKENKKIVEQIVAQPEQPLPTDLKSLIVEQDSRVGSFVSNPMFTNPQVVNPDNNAKRRMPTFKDLLN